MHDEMFARSALRYPFGSLIGFPDIDLLYRAGGRLPDPETGRLGREGFKFHTGETMRERAGISPLATHH